MISLTHVYRSMWKVHTVCFKESQAILIAGSLLLSCITQKVLKVSTPNMEYLLILTRCSCKTRNITLKDIILELCPFLTKIFCRIWYPQTDKHWYHMQCSCLYFQQLMCIKMKFCLLFVNMESHLEVNRLWGHNMYVKTYSISTQYKQNILNFKYIKPPSAFINFIFFTG